MGGFGVFGYFFFRKPPNLLFCCTFKSPGNAHLQPKAAGAGEARSYKKLDIDVVGSGKKQECRLAQRIIVLT